MTYRRLQVLLSHDFGLAKCLLHHLEQMPQTVSDWYSLQELKQPDFCNGCLCSSAGCCDPATKLTTQDVHSSLMHILVHVGGGDPDVLLKTLLPAIRPRLDFQVFDRSQVGMNKEAALSTDYRYETRTGPSSCFASKNS